MRQHIILLIAMVCVIPVAQLPAQNFIKQVGEIKYVSQNSYYVNLGSQHGLSVGDTLMVKQNSATIGRLMVENIARLSSACRSLDSRSFRKGDRVEVLVKDSSGAVTTEENSEDKRSSRFEAQGASPSPSPISRSKRSRREVNRLSGRFSVQSLFFDDKSGSDLDYRQLGFRSKLSVENFLGSPLELRFRMRSRAHHRETVVSDAVEADQWTNSLYELGLVYENSNSPVEFGFGRILSRHVRGLGYIDGGLFSMKMNGSLRVGVVGGTQPSARSSAFQTDEQKFGVFMNYERGDYATGKWSSTVAFSGSYHGGKSSREFVYLQNTFSAGSRLSLYQTVEFDVNRGWKADFANDKFQLTNFFVSARYSPVDAVSFNLSYDARKAVRYYETRSIPDSLFDEATRQGLRGGVTLRLPSRIRLSGNLGIRFRKGELQNTVSASSALTVPRIFRTWATLNARFSYFSTRFTKGYRPSASLRIPVMRGLAVNVGAGASIYETGSRTTRHNWIEAGGYYRINRWLFANAGYRGYVNQALKSNRIFLETGIVF